MSENIVKGGVLCLNKSAGGTSHDAVNRIRRLYQTKQVGHTGTLDPMARGVLVVMVGRAVKASEFLVSDNKSYKAGIKLGITTDTEDTDGKVLSVYDGVLPTLEEVTAAANSFLGETEQMPPMYSALKVGGQKLVDIARRGGEVQRSTRKIVISDIKVNDSGTDSEYCLEVSCSKGTYIRTLCSDIGKKIGCGAVMSSLLRTRSGVFDISESVTVEELESMDLERRYSLLRPVENLFSEYPGVFLSDFYSRLAQSGCEIYQKKTGSAYEIGEMVRMYDKEGFFALGKVGDYADGTAIKSVKLFRI